MSEPKWTPGPWSVVGGDEVHWVESGTGDTVVEVVNKVGNGLGDPMADAHLIAAAPDLYAVLKSIEWSVGDFGDCPVCLNSPPSTGGIYPSEGHEPDCELNAALRKAENRDNRKPINPSVFSSVEIQRNILNCYHDWEPLHAKLWGYLCVDARCRGCGTFWASTK